MRRCFARWRAILALAIRSADPRLGDDVDGTAAGGACQSSAPRHGAPRATRSSGSSCWRSSWSPAHSHAMAALGARRGPCWTGSTPTSGPPSTPAARPRSTALLRGLDGRLVPPGPSGAPTRGRPDVLPTGRNFYSVDMRAVPTPAAWQLGWRSAELLVEQYLQEHGDWPRAVALSAWGTANMRTGGDDIAQALALIGCRPSGTETAGRVTGVEVLPLAMLGRPRVDVTLRISGFFRDAFPAQIELLDDAVRAVAALDEPEDDNPLAAYAAPSGARWRPAAWTARPPGGGRRIGVFGTKPGAYGAGLQALIDERGWHDDGDLAGAYLAWGGYAYGRGVEGEAARGRFRASASRASSWSLHNQDNREHDLLDSDDYYQFEGGLAATVRTCRGAQPRDLPQRPFAPGTAARRARSRRRSARVVRGRAANPKWIARRDAPRLQGRVRDRGHGRLSVRLRRHRRCGRRPSFRSAVRRLSRRRAVRGFMPTPIRRPCARSPSASPRRSSAASGSRAATAPPICSTNSCRTRRWRPHDRDPTESDEAEDERHREMARKQGGARQDHGDQDRREGPAHRPYRHRQRQNTAALGMVLRASATGCGRRGPVRQGRRVHRRARLLGASPSSSRSRSWARASPGRRRTAPATSPPPAPPGSRPS